VTRLNNRITDAKQGTKRRDKFPGAFQADSWGFAKSLKKKKGGEAGWSSADEYHSTPPYSVYYKLAERLLNGACQSTMRGWPLWQTASSGERVLQDSTFGYCQRASGTRM